MVCDPTVERAEPAWIACSPERCCGQRLRSTSSAATVGAGDTENCHTKLFVCDIPTQPHPFYKYRAGLTPELSRPAARRQLSTNIPEKFAAAKLGRLERIVSLHVLSIFQTVSLMSFSAWKVAITLMETSSGTPSLVRDLYSKLDVPVSLLHSTGLFTIDVN